MGYKLIWEIQIKMAFLYHEGGNDAGLCRRIWLSGHWIWQSHIWAFSQHYICTHSKWKCTRLFIVTGFGWDPNKTWHIYKINPLQLWKKKNKMSAFSVPMYRGVQAVQLSRESNVQSSIQCGLHFCVIKWGGWEQYVLSLSVSICKKKYWKDK